MERRRKKVTIEINHNDWRISLLHIINQNKIELVYASRFDVRLINFWRRKKFTNDLTPTKCKHY